jgi:hypothetical protein
MQKRSLLPSISCGDTPVCVSNLYNAQYHRPTSHIVRAKYNRCLRILRSEFSISEICLPIESDQISDVTY